MHNRLLLAAGCCLAALVAGCGDNTAPATEAAATQAPIVQNPLPSPGTIKNDATKRKHIIINQCASTGSGWSATGTAANPGKEPAKYAITVFFTTESATVVDYAQTTVNVDPGKTAEWKAVKEFTAPAKTLCVLRAVD